MSGGSVSSSFSGGSYEFDGIDVNINGRVNCTYYYQGNCSIQCPSGSLMNIIESMLYRFVKMLPSIVDVSYDTIDFFGDVIAVDDNIKTFPIYFVLSGNKYNLYKIDPQNVTNIRLVSKYNNMDDAIDYLYGIDKQLVENYYEQDDDYDDDDGDWGDYDESDCEVYVNGQLISEANSDIINVCQNYDEQDINGDCNYDIVEVMHGDITGDMYGNIEGVMHGDVMGDMKGNINKVMHGDVMGDMYGDINGVMHGDVMGDMYGNINGVMYGDIMGSFSGKIYGKMYGEITE